MISYITSGPTNVISHDIRSVTLDLISLVNVDLRGTASSDPVALRCRSCPRTAKTSLDRNRQTKIEFTNGGPHPHPTGTRIADNRSSGEYNYRSAKRCTRDLRGLSLLNFCPTLWRPLISMSNHRGGAPSHAGVAQGNHF